MAIEVNIGTVPVFAQLPDGNTAVFPQAKIKGTTSTVLSTVSLTSSGNGGYKGSVTLNTPGYYIATFIIYTDSGHTSESPNYGRSSQVYRVIDEAAVAQEIANLVSNG